MATSDNSDAESLNEAGILRLSEDENEEELPLHNGPTPYMFEPTARGGIEREGEPSGQATNPRVILDPSRLESERDWCLCNNCVPMPTIRECTCCREITQVLTKIESYSEEGSITCITEHPGFESGCLNPWVLEIAYLNYTDFLRQGPMQRTQHEKYRYTAYRQLVRWCWRYLGHKIRVPLPACAVKKIRDTFPEPKDGHYTGFRPPVLD